MANWNNEYYVALEGRDLQANAMAVDSTGTYVLLAGRRCIAIRNLNEEHEIVQKFPRQSKYDVGSAEWNPTSHHRGLCVISSNQRLEVLTWHKDQLTQSHSLRAHTRVITDLNWHRSDPNLLASCSVDTFIHIWDLRDSRRPSLSLSAVAEASQVRWNKISPHLLATAHEGDLKIWDQRKGTVPVHYIAGHLAKIHGLDWSPTQETQLATSSQDSTVKFFDISNPRKPEYVLNTNAPVWRARYTPFGNGLITVVVPQLRRGENSLLLWNTANRATPMHTFIGHRDVVLEFEWRKKHPNEQDFQLVTWSKDQSLLVWKIEPFLQKLCGYEPDEAREIEDISTDPASNNKQHRKHSTKVHPLQQEFTLLNVDIPNLQILKIDHSAKLCQVQAQVNKLLIILEVTFPNGYPHGIPPIFQVQTGSSITDSMATQILQTLNHLAQQRVSKNRTCLESCLRQLVSTLEQLSRDSENETVYETSYIEPVNVFGGCNDAYIPFPRTSGIKFCSADVLICFGRPPHTRKSAKIELTPRALSALEVVYTKRPNDQTTISTHYSQKQRSKSKRNSAKTSSRALVHIYDASGLFLVNKQLAEEYILNGDVSTICKHNAAAAAVVGRWDLVQAWTLAELIAGPQQAEEDNIWHMHPFGNQLMQSLITHYATHNDIQMAAMLCCIVGKDQDCASRKVSSKNIPGSPESPPYHSIPPADVIADGWVFPTLKTARSSSMDNLRLEEIVPSLPQRSTFNVLYEYYKMSYAETLYRWGLLYNRAEVLKYMHISMESHKGVEFITDCKYCDKPAKHCSCSNCKRLSLSCVICHISVRGSANCCLICGHGGHTKHLQQWFVRSDVCASGCGCKCKMETASIFTT